jgi:phage terminase large subunit-like protein
MKVQIPYAANSRNGFYWPDSDQKYLEVMSVKRNSPTNFEDIYQGRPGHREGSIFLKDDLDAFYVAPENLTLGLNAADVAAFVKKGHCTIQAWDTAFSTTLQSAHTVCTTGLLVPCNSYHRGEDPLLLGECESHFDVLLLEVLRKRYDWGDLVSAFKTQHMKWRPEQIILEKKASGISLFQAMKNSNLPILTVTPTDSKGARATNSIQTKTAGSVQGWFRQHRVLRPHDEIAPWIAPWLAEMKDFSGNDDASSDQVDATVHLVTRAITMGAGMAFLPSGWSPERSALPASYSDPMRNLQRFGAVQDPRSAMLNVIGMLPDLVNDPFDGTCGRCDYFKQSICGVHKRHVTALDGCGDFYDAGLAAAERSGQA